MAHIVITSGPTREYLDPVRFLTNGSSGRMGCALAAAALQAGFEVTVISGPVTVDYPPAAALIPVVSTAEMLDACQRVFDRCVGLIAAAAPCDYRPERVAAHKIRKRRQPLDLRLVETPDIVATLARRKRPDQWIVGFALETQDARQRALQKMRNKQCDLMVVNGPAAIDASASCVLLLGADGQELATIQDTKANIATAILAAVRQFSS